MTAAPRARALWGRRPGRTLGVLALALLLVVTLGVVGVRGWRYAQSPDYVLDHYLDALLDGDLDALREYVDLGADERQRALLSDDATRPTEALIDETQILHRRETSLGWQFIVEVTQDGKTTAVPLLARPASGPDGEETEWVMDRASLGTLSLSIPSEAIVLRINGVDFSPQQLGRSNHTLQLLVLPGRYTVAAVGPDGQVGEPESYVFGITASQITLNPTLGSA